MSGRRGFSLVELVIVLVLAGIVSTAAITMFITQNKLNAQMTALGESQENARSAVLLAASELHGAANGSVIDATASSITLRLPLVLGIVCGQQNPQFKDVYLPLNGVSLRDADVDGYAVLGDDGRWSNFARIPNGNLNRGGSGRTRCIATGGGAAGTDSDYSTLRVDGGIGTPVMLYRDVTYYFAASALDASRRGFFRATGGQAVELAHGFSDDSHFEYQLAGATWDSTVRRGDLDAIEAVRIAVEVTGQASSGSASGSARFGLVRDVQLRNVR